MGKKRLYKFNKKSLTIYKLILNVNKYANNCIYKIMYKIKIVKIILSMYGYIKIKNWNIKFKINSKLFIYNP